MDLSEIKQYPHKILQINVNNTNDVQASMYDTAAFKVTIPEIQDNEIVVFSTDKELNTDISCTQNGHDYFLMIPNIQGISTIYAHVFISDLYNEKHPKSDETFVNYDLEGLSEHDNFNSYNYESEPPRISSIINDVSKDPNYKQYNIDLDKNGKPLQGRFPVSSRYGYSNARYQYNKNIELPTLEQSSSTFKRTNVYNENSQNEKPPTWEAYIPRDDIGDVIPKDNNDTQYPVNVYLNYEYLPTSTEYHQHFYGFESNKEYTNIRDKNRQINVFEGSNLETVNGAFFNDVQKEKYTYRLINVGDKADYSNAKDFQHLTESIDLWNYTINHASCTWRKNNCNNYYIYTAKKDIDDRGLYYPIELEPNERYILRYYIFIPNTIDIDDDCYIEVQSVSPQVQTIGSLKDVFKEADSHISNQWIYHEIPFATTQKNHRLYIKGHKQTDTDIFFGNIELLKTVKYSPTIKYTSQGVFVVENNTFIKKSNKDYENYEEENSSISNKPPLIAENNTPNIPYNDFYIDFQDTFDIYYNSSSKILSYYPGDGYSFQYEKRYNNTTGEEEWNLYFILDDEYVETITPNTGYIPGENILYKYEKTTNEEVIDEETNETVTREKITSISIELKNQFEYKPIDPESNLETLITDEPTEPDARYKLIEHRNFTITYEPKKLFTYGTNNKFKLEVSNEHQVGMNTGYVECAITTNEDENKNIKTESVKYLGKKYISQTGEVNYTRIDFTKIPKSQEYFLRIDYKHPCYDEIIHSFKKVQFTNEQLVMDIQRIYGNNTFKIGKEYTARNIDEFPLEIQAYVRQEHDESQGTDWGYCELSIDDKIIQTNYVNIRGEAVFYLNPSDIPNESQVVKIEYYRKYNEVVKTTHRYFTLKRGSGLDVRDAVPIRFNVLNNEQEEQQKDNIEISKDDCLIIDIDTNGIGNDINYSISLYIDNQIANIENKPYHNITSQSDENNLLIVETYNNNIPLNKVITYKIVTDSLIQNINNNKIYYSNDKYRRYSKEFKVTWI